MMYLDNTNSNLDKIYGDSAEQCLTKCDQNANCKFVQYIPKPTPDEELLLLSEGKNEEATNSICFFK